MGHAAVSLQKPERNGSYYWKVRKEDNHPKGGKKPKRECGEKEEKKRTPA